MSYDNYQFISLVISLILSLRPGGRHSFYDHYSSIKLPSGPGLATFLFNGRHYDESFYIHNIYSIYPLFSFTQNAPCPFANQRQPGDILAFETLSGLLVAELQLA